jgi:tetratricopeptide (TPR) repeat protein
MRGLIVLVVFAMAVWGQPGWAAQDDPRLDGLFADLRTADQARAAVAIETEIWRIWIETKDEALDLLMARGAAAMQSGNYRSALVAFNAIVEAAPDFAEGWNKRATLYWLMGEHEKSIADIDRTLALEPRHFGALSGLALIREAQDKPDLALDALKRAAAVHPRMGYLEQRIRQLNRALGEPI